MPSVEGLFHLLRGAAKGAMAQFDYDQEKKKSQENLYNVMKNAQSEIDVDMGQQGEQKVPEYLQKQKEAKEKPDVVGRTLDSVLNLEGGFVDDPDDSGGPTNKGITLATYQSLKPEATLEDLKNITDAEVRDIFRDEYVTKPKIDQLPDRLIPIVSGFSINAGQTQAIKTLQRAIGVKADGRIGPVTIKAAQDANPNVVKEAIDKFYKDLAKRKPKKKKFLDGWLARNSQLSKLLGENE